MAFVFCYEKEHYDISMQIGNLVLLSTVKKAKLETYILASGNSRQHQIHDGKCLEALHSVSFMKMMLKE